LRDRGDSFRFIKLNTEAKIAIELIVDKTTKQSLDVYSRVLTSELTETINKENDKNEIEE